MNKDNEYKGESFTIEFPRIFIPPVHSLKSSFYYYKMQNGTKVCAISLFQQVPVAVVFLFFFPSLWGSKRPTSLAFRQRNIPSVSRN